jgi:DNA-binding NarL/FixJ family response regulator
MYRDMFIDYGVDHELMCCLPTVGTRTRRLLFARGPGPDFDERDRTVLTLLRPHLVELHTRRTAAAERSETRALTSRQMELLRLVAAGKSTQQIADALFLSPRTVRKHLENIFERLGVTNRTAAVVRGLAEG